MCFDIKKYYYNLTEAKDEVLPIGIDPVGTCKSISSIESGVPTERVKSDIDPFDIDIVFPNMSS